MLDWLGPAAVVVAAAVAGRALRRRLLPSTTPPATATVGTAVLGTATVLVVAQLLGLVGAFGTWAVALGCAVVAGAVVAGLGRRPAPSTPPSTAEGPASPEVAERPVVRLVGIGLLAATTVQWTVAVVPTVRRGFADVDALHYHLPHAVGFARTGRLLPVQVLDVGHPSGWYPSNDEVLRALLLPGAHELLVVLVNGAAAALLVLAAWSVGRRWGRPWTAVTLVTALLCGPLYGAVYGGWAHVDWTAVAFLVAAVAVLVGEGMDATVGAVVVAGVALGVAAGTKLPVTPAVALVAVAAVAVAPTGRRIGTGLRLVLPATVVGGWWYVRNLVVIGTPFPGLPLSGGPDPLAGAEAPAVAAYLGDGRVIRDFFVPGLRLFFGVAWPVLVGVLAVGVVTAAWRRSGWARWLAGAAVVATAAYLVLPTTALGPPGQPVLFTANLRYLWPALALASLATAAATRGSWPALLATAAAVAGLAEGRAWAVPGPEARVVAVAVAAGAVVVAARVRVPAPWLRTAAGVVVVVTAVVLAGPLRSIHVRDRWTRSPSSALAGYTTLFAIMRDLPPTTVAVSGYPLNHPFLGPTLANDLRVPHVTTAEGAFRGHPDCAGYRRDLATHGVTTAAVLAGGPTPAPPELAWLVSDPASRVLASTPRGVVVALDRPPDPSTCPTDAADLDGPTLRELLRLPTDEVREAVRARVGLAGAP